MIPGAEVINMMSYVHMRNADESLVKHKAWINTKKKSIIYYYCYNKELTWSALKFGHC